MPKGPRHAFGCRVRTYANGLFEQTVALASGPLAGRTSGDRKIAVRAARRWSTAHPARIVEILHESGVTNPIALVDEIEKAGGSERNGRIWDVPLPRLEPEVHAALVDAMSKGASSRNIAVMVEQVLAIELKRRRVGLN